MSRGRKYCEVPLKGDSFRKFLRDWDKRFGARLSEEQRKALWSYKNDGHLINRALRAETWEGKEVEPAVRLLDSALQDITLGKNLILYRGWDFEENDDHVKNAAFEDLGFMSTSLWLETAARFAKSTILRIHAPAETRGAFIDTCLALGQEGEPGQLFESEEFEVLLARETLYRVMGPRQEVAVRGGSRRLLVDVEIVPTV